MYYDAKGLPTIGVGHLLTTEELDTGLVHVAGIDVHWKSGLTEQEADELLAQDVALAEAAVSHYVLVTLLQHQFDCLVSFVFNIGVPHFSTSTLLRLLNAGQPEAVPGELLHWVYVRRQVNHGLVTRRQDEARQWEGG